MLMGNRLSKIYARTGDQGTTGLADGSRVDKDSNRVQAMGDVDELNTHIGSILLHPVDTRIAECLVDIQHALFDIGGEMAIPEHAAVNEDYVTGLENMLDELNEHLLPLKEFILLGGGPAAIACHLARTVCRRAERRLVTLARDESVNQESRRYLNRLSDLLFVLARVLARGDSGEVYWKHGRNAPVNTSS